MLTHKNKTVWWHYIIPPAFLSVLTALVYYPSLHYEFQFDDLANITKHFQIRHNSLMNLFFSGTRWISYWLNSLHFQIGRFDPFSYRVGNVMIHTFNGLLVYYIIKRALSYRTDDSFFTRNAHMISLVCSLLFLVHPVQTQTVSYVIQGQLEGMACFFILSMTYIFLLTVRTRSMLSMCGMTGLLWTLAAFSSGSKEIAIVAPPLVLLTDWFFVAQGSLQDVLKRKWIHIGLFGIIGGLYIWFLKPSFFGQIFGLQMEAKNNIGNVITHDPSHTITPLHYFISQFKVIVHYLWIFLWPLGISVEYDWKLVEHFFAPDCLGPFLLLVGIFTTLFYLLRKNKAHLGAFGLLWFFIAIAPRSTIVPSPELLVDYKTYPASLGWLFLIAALLVKMGSVIMNRVRAQQAKPEVNTSSVRGELAVSGEASAKTGRIHSNGVQQNLAQLAGLMIIAAPLSFLTIQRNMVWRSGLEFWNNMIQNAPGKARAYNNYGVELSQKLKKFQESIPYFQQAIAMDKNYPDPCNNLAVAYAATGNIDGAINAIQQGLKINRFYPEGYNNLASFFIRKKDYGQAEKSLAMALKLRPWYGKAYFNLGRLYLETNKKEKAWECFKKCCTEADLDNELGFSSYGKCSLELGKYDEAIWAFNKLLEVAPKDTDVFFNMANAYYMKKEYNMAISWYHKAQNAHPHDPRIWYNLGEAHYSMQQYQKALDNFKKVAQLPTCPPNANMRMAACYEQLGQPKRAHEVLAKLRTKPLDLMMLEKIKTAQADLERIHPELKVV